MSRPTVAYKIIDAGDWAAARAAGAFAGSADDRRDGFIHLSTAEQLAETARRHYAGRDGLALLTVDLAALGDTVRWEPSRGGALFPHIYGLLPASAVVAERPLSVDAEGRMSGDGA